MLAKHHELAAEPGEHLRPLYRRGIGRHEVDRAPLDRESVGLILACPTRIAPDDRAACPRATVGNLRRRVRSRCGRSPRRPLGRHRGTHPRPLAARSRAWTSRPVRPRPGRDPRPPGHARNAGVPPRTRRQPLRPSRPRPTRSMPVRGHQPLASGRRAPPTRRRCRARRDPVPPRALAHRTRAPRRVHPEAGPHARPPAGGRGEADNRRRPERAAVAQRFRGSERAPRLRAGPRRSQGARDRRGGPPRKRSGATSAPRELSTCVLARRRSRSGPGEPVDRADRRRQAALR